MQYKIVETQPYKVFGMDVVQTDDWELPETKVDEQFTILEIPFTS